MNLYIESNLGDPGLFEGTASLEALLVERLGSLMHLPEACGYATSGGHGIRSVCAPDVTPEHRCTFSQCRCAGVGPFFV
jgi:hypothetical protein